MKKIFIVLQIMSLSITSLFAVELYVGINQTYSTISAAYAVAQPNDEIIIHPGFYEEHLDIYINISLTGSTADPTDVDIQSDYYGYSPIQIHSGATCDISNITVSRACGEGIGMYNATVTIENCIAEYNEYAGIASCISDLIVRDCVIRNNGVYGMKLDIDPPDRDMSIIENTLVYGNGFEGGPNNGAGIRKGEGQISNCTIVNNRRGVTIELQQYVPTISNCIIYGNQLLQVSTYITDVTYSDISGGFAGTGNIDADPLFVDPVNDDYYLAWSSSEKSPCIDSGDPSIFDPDGTPSDIGAFRVSDHKYDIVDLPSQFVNQGLKWLSFPALDNVYQSEDADQAHYLLFNILYPENESKLNKVYFEGIPFIYQNLNNEWQNISFIFPRTTGYIFEMNEAAELTIKGFKEPDNSTVTLTGSGIENWVGYWLEETQSVEDAFSNYWDGSNIYQIQHQNWTATYLEDDWYIQLFEGEKPAISYGEMVIVKCYDAIINFSWDNSTPPEPKTTYLETQYYTFEEEPAYTPIYVELIPDDLPQEIGAFVNGQCIGASVVQDEFTQINAYTTSAPAGNIELELYYGSRSAIQSKHIRSYNCANFNNPHHVMQQLNTSEQTDAWFISLRENGSIVNAPDKVSLTNYPNPFNPITTIAYGLPYADKVTINIFNIKGQLVKQLVSGNQSEGYYEAVWNGKDDAGKHVSSGIYYYRISTCGKTINKKMLLLK
ncbi:MAG: right-handed parallel beta-helix repeat-containing protein [Candidatus Cloacimonetes bacterium]|nr:right-handed parallel beta-helix repeat-containing protein [Candidatus Cloacimonadota bacterium]MCF7813199.1 right-handed parallel beta-helix repeat-containing protein [Candidatus Cloacimonadota bacterium]MCF7867647.1 right-handed parallel beta-helix repeat-containing protein [Candidatus Cloacimonadota bacterium]MCF7883078.1 right-handed parallel beta-helix repeat-containing protein [Candidatus Cloacimonadota bacterium]